MATEEEEGAAAQGGVPVWEQSKENVLPLPRGRNVNKIKKAFGESEAHVASQAKKIADLKRSEGVGSALRTPAISSLLTRLTYFLSVGYFRQHEATIQAYSGEDPLSPWLKYIRAVRDELPNDQKEQFELLEACARHFKSTSHYRNDQRYIKVWISYANHLTNPSDLFMFLYKNDIGKDVALFWVAWAYVAEVRSDFTTAHKLFTKAQDRVVDDAELVRSRFKQFMRRMNRLWVNYQEEEGIVDTVGRGSAELGRDALEKLKKHALGNAAQAEQVDRPRENDENAVGAASRPSSRRGLGLARGGARGGLSTSGSPSTAVPTSNTAAFAVFDESAFTGAPSSRAYDQFDAALDEGGTGWEEFGTRKQRDQENILGPSAWTDSAFPSSIAISSRGQASAVAPAAPLPAAIPIFVEEEFREEAQKQSPAKLGSKKIGIRSRLDAHQQQDGELLAQNPLLFMKDKEAAAAHDRARAAAPPLPTMVRSQAVPRSEERDEMQFEEHRALLYVDKIGPEHPDEDEKKVHGSSEDDLQHDIPVGAREDDTSTFALPTNPTSVMMQTASRRGVSEVQVEPKRTLFSATDYGNEDASATVADHKAAASTAEAESSSPFRSGMPCRPMQRSEEDMTINTKVAFEDLNDMFCSPKKEPKISCEPLYAQAEEPASGHDPFQVFEDPDGNIASAALGARQGPTSAAAGFSVFVDEDDDRENAPRRANPFARNLADPGVEDSVFKVLEERPQENVGTVYEEEADAEEQRPAPNTQRRRGLGTSIIMDELPPRRTNRDVIRGIIAGDTSIVAGDRTFTIVDDAPRGLAAADPGSNSVLFSIYDDGVEPASPGGNSTHKTEHVGAGFHVFEDAAPSAAAEIRTTPRVSTTSGAAGGSALSFTIFDDTQGPGLTAGAPSRRQGPGFVLLEDDITTGAADTEEVHDLFGGPFAAELSRIAETGEDESFGIFHDQQGGSASRGGRLDSWNSKAR
jgi:hypothetical protein